VEAAYGAALKFSSEASATATRSFTGRQIAFDFDSGPGRSIVAIFVDGERVATIDLYAAEGQWSRVMYSKRWSTSDAHWITVRVTGTKRAASTGTRVDVDAFVVLR